MVEGVIVAGRGRVVSVREGEEQSDLPDVKDELTFYQYKVQWGLLEGGNSLLLFLVLQHNYGE